MHIHSSLQALWLGIRKKVTTHCYVGCKFSTGGDFYHENNKKNGNEQFSYVGGAGSQHNNAGSAKEQFDSQQSAYHRHSFHRKGEGFGASENEKLHKGSRGTFTGQEKKSLASRWENAFFGRVHFEDGMHQRYAEAVEAEEKEKERDRERWCDLHGNCNYSQGNSRGTSTIGNLWFPNWSEDESTPRNLFHSLSAKEKLRFIIERLSKGERRIKFSPDYGGLSMMAQLNLGEFMIKDAEKLLLELDWMTPDLQANIESIKKEACRIKFDYDLD